jgi:hypothetical protein
VTEGRKKVLTFVLFAVIISTTFPFILNWIFALTNTPRIATWIDGLLFLLGLFALRLVMMFLFDGKIQDLEKQITYYKSMNESYITLMKAIVDYNNGEIRIPSYIVTRNNKVLTSALTHETIGTEEVFRLEYLFGKLEEEKENGIEN